MSAQRDYPLNLPPPYLRYHNASSSSQAGRAPLQSTSTSIDSCKDVIQVPRMPTADELAVSPIPETFRCPLCLDVLDHPMTTIPCGHTFCENCILRSMEDAADLSPPRAHTLGGGSAADELQPCTLCPVCRCVVRKDCLAPCWIVRDIVDNIVIRCDYGVSFNFITKNYEAGISGGCGKTFRFAERVKHLQECGHVMVPCSFAADGCPAMCRRAQIRAHDQECAFRSETCSCGDRVRSSSLDQHRQVCSSVLISCPHGEYGCMENFPRAKLSEHLESCAYEVVKDILAAKDRLIEDLERKNLTLEESLWSAVKSRQMLEVRLVELQAQLNSAANPADGGVTGVWRKEREVMEEAAVEEEEEEEVEKGLRENAEQELEAEEKKSMTVLTLVGMRVRPQEYGEQPCRPPRSLYCFQRQSARPTYLHPSSPDPSLLRFQSNACRAL